MDGEGVERKRTLSQSKTGSIEVFQRPCDDLFASLLPVCMRVSVRDIETYRARESSFARVRACMRKRQ